MFALVATSMAGSAKKEKRGLLGLADAGFSGIHGGFAAPLATSYAAPLATSYAAPLTSYVAAPALATSYAAPARKLKFLAF